jgi:O-antigen ligase
LIIFTPFFSIVSTRFLKTLFIFNEGGLILRLKQAKEIFNLIKISPFFGWGTGQTIVSAIKINPYGIFASQPFEIHNFYLLITGENGIISLALFFIFLFLVFKKAIYLKDNFSIFFLSMMTNLLIIGLFQPYIFIDLILYFIPFLNFKLSKNEEIKKYI